MSIALIDLKYAKNQLHVNNPDSDIDIVAKIEIASALVLQVCKLSAVPDEWMVGSPATIEAPADVKGLTCIWVAKLFYDRENPDLFSEDVMNYIRLMRTPTIA